MINCCCPVAALNDEMCILHSKDINDHTWNIFTIGLETIFQIIDEVIKLSSMVLVQIYDNT